MTFCSKCNYFDKKTRENTKLNESFGISQRSSNTQQLMHLPLSLWERIKDLLLEFLIALIVSVRLNVAVPLPVLNGNKSEMYEGRQSNYSYPPARMMLIDFARGGTYYFLLCRGFCSTLFRFAFFLRPDHNSS